MSEIINIKTFHELPIGTQFTIDGADEVLQVVKRNTTVDCELCVFNKTQVFGCPGVFNFFSLPCNHKRREDRQDVYYKKVRNNSEN